MNYPGGTSNIQHRTLNIESGESALARRYRELDQIEEWVKGQLGRPGCSLPEVLRDELNDSLAEVRRQKEILGKAEFGKREGGNGDFESADGQERTEVAA